MLWGEGAEAVIADARGDVGVDVSMLPNWA